jgi:hypothetical protein
MYNMYKASVSPGSVQQIMPYLQQPPLLRQSSHLNGRMLNPSYSLSLYSHGTDHAENTVLLLRNLTTGRREASSHCCLLDRLQNCCLATSCNIRYNNGLPIVVMQY